MFFYRIWDWYPRHKMTKCPGRNNLAASIVAVMWDIRWRDNFFEDVNISVPVCTLLGPRASRAKSSKVKRRLAAGQGSESPASHCARRYEPLHTPNRLWYTRSQVQPIHLPIYPPLSVPNVATLVPACARAEEKAAVRTIIIGVGKRKVPPTHRKRQASCRNARFLFSGNKYTRERTREISEDSCSL